VITSIGMSLGFGLSAWELFRWAPRSLRQTQWTGAGTFLVVTLLFVTRTAFALLTPPPPTVFVRGNPGSLIYLATVVLSIMMTLAYVTMASRRRHT
ncbi:hypothetical protein ACI4A9_27935, partial [Klebsiella pneumoniae]|uniref:hypothetical protein n=1 Tax=Klebsiella pneumoniae TaxID=573 RepID=UPI003852739B